MSYAEVKTGLDKWKADIHTQEALLQYTEASDKAQKQALLTEITAVGKTLHDMVDGRMKQLKVCHCCL